VKRKDKLSLWPMVLPWCWLLAVLAVIWISGGCKGGAR
jgi:hypothetical protein